jgi:hypothetical protein
MRVQSVLNSGRAIRLCWMANSASRPRLVINAFRNGTCGAASMDFGTSRLPTKPSAYRKVRKNTA